MNIPTTTDNNEMWYWTQGGGTARWSDEQNAVVFMRPPGWSGYVAGDIVIAGWDKIAMDDVARGFERRLADLGAMKSDSTDANAVEVVISQMSVDDFSGIPQFTQPEVDEGGRSAFADMYRNVSPAAEPERVDLSGPDRILTADELGHLVARYRKLLGKVPG